MFHLIMFGTHVNLRWFITIIVTKLLTYDLYFWSITLMTDK